MPMGLDWPAQAFGRCDALASVAPAAVSEAGLAQAFDYLPQGMILADRSLRIVFANREARAILAAADGLHAGPAGLRAETPDQTRALRRMIQDATNAAPGGALALRRRLRRRPLTVLVMPLGADRRNGPPVGPAASALILVVDPDRAPPPSAAQLRQLYGLTHAEAEVAVAAVRGEGLSAIAADLGVSLTTARTHLQHVFEKTGTRRQAELVRLILASGVNLRDAGAVDTPRDGLAPTAPAYRDSPLAPRAWSAGGGA